MKSFIALLRAVNVGGTGKLPMGDLKALCIDAGFGEVRTYIASGNVVLRTRWAEARIKQTLEGALCAYAGKPVGVLVRSAAEMAQVAADNPFTQAPPNRCVVIFLDHAPAADTLAKATHRNGEQIALGRREIYVDYGDGMAQSRLKLPSDRIGTGRNLNTVRKLAAMAAE